MNDLAVETQDITVDTTPVTQVEETEVSASPDTSVESGHEGEAHEAEPQETPEDKLQRLERDVAGKQKAIDRKTAAYHALQKKHDEQRTEAEKLSELIKKQTPDVEPVIDNFETHEDYVEALVDYRSKAKMAEYQQNLSQQQEQMRQAKVMQDRQSILQGQEAAYMDINPSYASAKAEVQGYLSSLGGIDPSVENAVIEQLYRGNVAEVTDYFGANNGENLEELGRISKMTPPEAAVELYKIQQRVSSSPQTKQKTTKPTPVKVSRGKSSTSKPVSKMSGKDTLDWVNS